MEKRLHNLDLACRAVWVASMIFALLVPQTKPYGGWILLIAIPIFFLPDFLRWLAVKRSGGKTERRVSRMVLYFVCLAAYILLAVLTIWKR